MSALVILQNSGPAPDGASFTGQGDLSVIAGGMEIDGGVVTLSGSGTVDTALEEFESPAELTVQIIEGEVLDRAPTSLTVVVSDGYPETDIDFYIDGNLVYTALSNIDGGLAPTTIEVPVSLGAAGSHTLTAVQTGSFTGSDTFTIVQDPALFPIASGADAPAVEVPGTLTENGTRRWVLQDLLPEVDGGIGSYVMPMNPKEMTSPFLEYQMTTKHTTALSGQFHVFEGASQSKQWTFSGFCPFQEMHDKLQQYRDLNRRFYIIDHRNRAWVSVIVDIEFSALLRKNYNNIETDWGHDYTATVFTFSQTWVVPA